MNDLKTRAIAQLVEFIYWNYDPSVQLSSTLEHRGGEHGRWYLVNPDLAQLNALDAVADLIHEPPAFILQIYLDCPTCKYRIAEELLPNPLHGMSCALNHEPVRMLRTVGRIRVR